MALSIFCDVQKSVEHLISGIAKALAHLLDMLDVARLHVDAQCAAIDFDRCIEAFVRDGYDVTTELGNDAAYARKLAGFVGKVDDGGVETTALDQAARDDAVEHIDGNIAARYEAANVLALNG